MDALIEHALSKSAVGAADHAFTADQPSETHQALRHELRMLDDIGRMGDHAGNEQPPRRQLGLFPNTPLVLVARIGHLQ
jgi:hypothetical protein